MDTTGIIILAGAVCFGVCFVIYKFAKAFFMKLEKLEKIESNHKTRLLKLFFEIAEMSQVIFPAHTANFIKRRIVYNEKFIDNTNYGPDRFVNSIEEYFGLAPDDKDHESADKIFSFATKKTNEAMHISIMLFLCFHTSKKEDIKGNSVLTHIEGHCEGFICESISDIQTLLNANDLSRSDNMIFVARNVAMFSKNLENKYSKKLEELFNELSTAKLELKLEEEY